MRASDLFLVVSLLALKSSGFHITRYDNVGVYWGQDAQGASNPNYTVDYQKTLSYYCNDNSTNIVQIAFLKKCFSTGGLPEIDVANTCNSGKNGTFPGTALANCQQLASDIEYCQEKGILVTLSIGGELGNTSLSDFDAGEFAEMVWNLFLGGCSDTRPFGEAVLDGVDLDIENGPPTGYDIFIEKIRRLAEGAEKKYYITAAPQCPFSNTMFGALNSSSLDAVFVQFYDNPCGLQNFNDSSQWNFGLWDYWARHVSPNKHVKVYIAALGAPSHNSTGYVPASTLSKIAVQMRQGYPSFGGVMLWDASQAYANGKYAELVKSALRLAGGSGFTYPPCSAYGYVEGEVYVGGQQVSYDGYIWEAKWWTDTEPTHNPLGPWNELRVCNGSPPVQPMPIINPSLVPMSSPSPSLVPGSSLTGSLANSGNGVFGRAYFRNTRSMLQMFFLLLALTVAGSWF